jgi:hypothetical protein
LILDIGNYLNQGTAKGKAKGFKLPILASLKEFKCKTTGVSLLEYIVLNLRKHSKEHLKFANDFHPCLEAAKLDMSALRTRIAELSKGATQLTTLIDTVREDEQFSVFVSMYGSKAYGLKG